MVLSGCCRPTRGLRVSTGPTRGLWVSAGPGRGLCAHTTGTCHFSPCRSCPWVQGGALSGEDAPWGCCRGPLSPALVAA